MGPLLSDYEPPEIDDLNEEIVDCYIDCTGDELCPGSDEIGEESAVFVYQDGVLVSSGTTMSGVELSSGGSMHVNKGGVADDTTITGEPWQWGNMYVSSGGVVNNTILNGDSDVFPAIHVYSGGVANSTTINYHGEFYLSGGEATDTTVNYGGSLRVSSGGIVTNATVNSGGDIKVRDGGLANNITVKSGGELKISSGTATNIIAEYGAVLSLYVAPDNYIEGSYNGSAFEMKDAYISGYTIDSDWELAVSSGGVANNITVKSGGTMYIHEGGMISGTLHASNGAEIFAEDGAVIDFTLTNRKSTDDYLVNDLSLITGTPTYTITVDADQDLGSYKLAQGASDFTGNITIGDGTVDYGNLTVNGEALNYNNKSYSLKLDDDNLTMVIGGDLPNRMLEGDLGYGVNQMSFSPELDYPGLYEITGSFGTLTGTIKITQGRTVVASGTIKNGELVFNGNKAVFLDSAKEYVVTIQNTGKSASAFDLSVADVDLFDHGDNSDDWTNLKSVGAGEGAELNRVGVLNTEKDSYFSDWVGFGDVVDYREITLESAAKLSFSFSTSDAAKFTIYKLVSTTSRGVTNYSLSVLQTISVAAPRVPVPTSMDTQGLLLSAGTYYIGVESTNAAKGGNAYYSFRLNDNAVFFNKGDNSDDVLYDTKTKEVNKTIASAGSNKNISITDGWVGYGDVTDYRKFTLDSAAKISFDLTATDATSFTINQLIANANGTYTVRAWQTTGLRKDAKTGQYSATTAGLLLQAGTYYFSMTSTNAVQGGSADYTVKVNDNSIFFTKGDNGSDNWLYDTKTKEVNKTIASAGSNKDISITDGWVGYGDAIDYRKFTLDSAAKISFDLTATDATSFTINQLIANANGTYTVRALQTTGLRKDAKTGQYTATTVGLLLQAGTYYLSMTSTNAVQGGSADYTVKVNDNSIFFTKGDNGSDNWLYDTKTKEVNPGIASAGSNKDISITDGWVGYGDAIDYRKFTLDSAAKISFNLTATDATSFTINQLIANANGTYTVRALQTTGLRKDAKTGQYTATTVGLLLQAGTYYLSMTSTNAVQGGNADYTVKVNDNSIFFTKGDNGSDNWLYDTKTREVNTTIASAGSNGAIAITDGWVGYGDVTDYRKFTLDSAAKISFDLTATDATSFTINQLIANANGTYTVRAWQTTGLRKDAKTGQYSATTVGLLLQAGTYYLSMTSTNAVQGGNADYTVKVNDNSIFFTKGDNGENNWLVSTSKALNTGLVDLGQISISSGIDSFAGGDGWVGYGDTTDFYAFSVSQEMAVNFTVTSSDNLTFAIYEVVSAGNDKNGNPIYSQRVLQTTTVKAGATVTTAKLKLSGDSSKQYFVGVTSTNAANGGNADYSFVGGYYEEPLRMTLGGILKSVLDKAEDDYWDNFGWESGVNWDEIRNNLLIQNNAIYGDIVGSRGDDVITCTTQRYRKGGLINLGDGNDQIILQDSIKKSKNEFLADEIDFGNGNNLLKVGSYSEITADKISFGDGNDQIIVGDYACDFWSEVVDFGDGKNLLSIGKGVDIGTESLRFGSGDDRVFVGKDSDVFFGGLSFGAGNDVLEIDGKLSYASYDFGAGMDTVKLNNGTFVAGGYYNYSVSGLEKITGVGTVVVNDDSTWLDGISIDSGVDIVWGGSGWDGECFSTKAKELSDNTSAKSVVVIGDDRDYDIWLCGGDLAECKEYGFADEVDWFKFTTYRNTTISVYVNIFGVSAVLYDSKLNPLGDLSEISYYGDIDFAAGTYYLKISVAPDVCASGYLYYDEEDRRIGLETRGQKYELPLRMTLDGMITSDYDAALDYYKESYNYYYDDDFWSDIDNLLTENNALYGDIIGTDGNDVITCTAERYREVDSISLGDGNDQIILQDSTKENENKLSVFGEIDFGSGNNLLKIGSHCVVVSQITFGDGNDQILVSDDADHVKARGIDFGNGDNLFSIGKNAKVSASIGIIEFGSGKDRVFVGEDADVHLSISFGAGDDVLEIEGKVLCDSYDFGVGMDTVKLNNGTFIVVGEDIPGLEKITGVGTVVVNDDSTWLDGISIDSGVDIVWGGSGWYGDCFSTKAKELADNTSAQALVLPDTGKPKHDIWLCGSDLAASKGKYGFADEVDWFKFTVDEGKSVGFNGYGDAELYDSNLNFLGNLNEINNDTYRLSDGTYYLKFSVDSDSCASGYVYYYGKYNEIYYHCELSSSIF